MVNMICVSCPVGCDMSVKKTDNSVNVIGNKCAAGIKYAKEELTNPTRNIATNVKVVGGDILMLSVKTKKPVPKGQIMDIVNEIHKITVKAPVEIGDVILKNALNCGVDIVATRRVGAVV